MKKTKCKDDNTQHILDKLDEEILNHEDGFEAWRRDIIYSSALYQVVIENRKNSDLKKRFFWIVCGLLGLVTLIGCAIILMVIIKGTTGIEAIVAVVSGFGTILSSILVLPQIIAKHLFPEDGERSKYEFLSHTIDQDLSEEGSYLDPLDELEYDEKTNECDINKKPKSADDS